MGYTKQRDELISPLYLSRDGRRPSKIRNPALTHRIQLCPSDLMSSNLQPASHVEQSQWADQIAKSSSDSSLQAQLVPLCSQSSTSAGGASWLQMQIGDGRTGTAPLCSTRLCTKLCSGISVYQSRLAEDRNWWPTRNCMFKNERFLYSFQDEHLYGLLQCLWPFPWAGDGTACFLIKKAVKTTWQCAQAKAFCPACH